jgi:NhaP-type Na+/H+ or K+/H+ antiporter
MSEVIEIEGETIPYQKVIVQGPVDFLRLVVLSVLIGLFFGVIATLITKNQRSISHSSILESALFISFAMISYFLAEFTDNSAIVSMLVTSMFLSHYTYYNLSPQGKVVISVTVQTLGYMAEATVFGYVGIVSA